VRSSARSTAGQLLLAVGFHRLTLRFRLAFTRYILPLETRCRCAALAAIVAAGAWLVRLLLELAGDRARVDSASGRMRFICQIATVPALAAIPLILPFRIPGPIDQVVIVRSR
jgi:hypothetical protein